MNKVEGPSMGSKKICPDCGDVSRRDFLKTAAATVPAVAIAKAPVWASTWRVEKPEQKEKMCFGWDHENRQKVSNNWDIVPQKIGTFYTGEQQQVLKDIFKG